MASTTVTLPLSGPQLTTSCHGLRKRCCRWICHSRLTQSRSPTLDVPRERTRSPPCSVYFLCCASEPLGRSPPFIAIWRRTISPPYTNLRERSISLSVRQRLFLGGGRLHVRSATAAGLLVCRDDLQIGTDRGRERATRSMRFLRFGVSVCRSMNCRSPRFALEAVDHKRPNGHSRN